jgi:thiol:disulfide interchange protein DsbD
MRNLRSLIIFLFILLIVRPALSAHTEARLLLDADKARPGDTVIAGVELKMESGWHTYWKNSGASGMPTSIKWVLPPGITAGEIQWPTPKKLPEEDLTTYIYEGETVLIVPLKLAPDVKPGPLQIQAKVSWLECEVMCLPGDAEVSATLAVGAESKKSRNAELIAAWQKRLPQPAEALKPFATWDSPALPDASSRAFILQWTPSRLPAEADFFPYVFDDFEVEAATERVTVEQNAVALRKKIKKLSGDWPSEIAGVIVQKIGDATESYEVKVRVAAASGASQSPSTRTSAGAAAPAEAALPLWLAVIYAFIGGLILNVMPCVLPVIALKILGFVNEAKSEPRRVRKLGFIYTLGVLTSFLGLAILVIGVKAAGHKAGWGMQFSSPQFTIGFAVLMTLVALNLFGVFEVMLGGRVMGAAGDLASRHGASGAFFNGVLATVLATPCTAPFLSVALGFAFQQSSLVISVIFLSAGAGLASPYLLLSWYPAWLKFLPKPGIWMEHFKQLMGFPMLATAIWLASLVSDRYGEHAWWLGVFLVFVAMAAWIYGQFVQRGTGRKRLATVIALVLLATGYAWALEGNMRWRFPTNPAAVSGTTIKNAPKGYPWQPWSTQAVANARNEGKVVIVDFTAKWCITCNSIVKPAFERETVIKALEREKAVALLADYTAYPPEITEELARFNRAGVPLVLVYPKDKSLPPVVLPDPNPLLGPGHYAEQIVEALEVAAK